MTNKTKSVSFGRGRLPKSVAAQLLALPPRLRGRAMAIIIQAHVTGLDLAKLVASAEELKRLGALIHQSLRISGGLEVDADAVAQALRKINSLR